MKTLLILLLSIASIICNAQIEFNRSLSQNLVYNNLGITKAACLLFRPSKQDGSSFNIDEIRVLIKQAIPQSRFESYVKRCKIVPIEGVKIVECEINAVGWKQDLTFNEFRKLIYEQ